MSTIKDQRIRFVPERYRREAARVRREANSEDADAVRRILLDIAERYDEIAQMMDDACP